MIVRARARATVCGRVRVRVFVWSGVEWSGVEWSGVEWSGVEWSGVGWGGGVGCAPGSVTSAVFTYTSVSCTNYLTGIALQPTKKTTIVRVTLLFSCT